MPLLSKVTVGMSLASVGVIGLLLLVESSGDARPRSIDPATAGAVAFGAFVFGLPYLGVGMLARARISTRRQVMTVFVVGTLICLIGVRAFAVDAWRYHALPDDEKGYHQGFVPQGFALIVQYILLAILNFSAPGKRPPAGDP